MPSTRVTGFEPKSNRKNALPFDIANEPGGGWRSRVRDYNAATSGAQPTSHPNLPDHDAVQPPASRSGEFYNQVGAIDKATPKNVKQDLALRQRSD